MTIRELYDKANSHVYDKNNDEDFRGDVEKAFEFSSMPESVKNKIHELAWVNGHSAGYSDVVTQYFDLVDLAKTCLE